MSALLAVRDLHVTYPDGTRALRGVDLVLHRGDRVAVVGESGSGKSTLVAAILGLLPRGTAVSGRVRLAGVEVTSARERDLRRLRGRTVGYVPQDPYAAIDPLRTVRHHLTEAARAHGLRLSAEAAAERFERLGIAPHAARARSFPHTWSGGMLQRAAIAAATVHGPELVLADEPTSALDHDAIDTTLAVLAEEAPSMLLVTHDLDVAARAADTALVMYAGRVVERGPAGRVLARPRHRYSAALVDALPRTGLPPAPLPGDPPDPRAADAGCAFRPRCRCAEQMCATTPLPEGDVACHFPA